MSIIYELLSPSKLWGSRLISHRPQGAADDINLESHNFDGLNTYIHIAP